MTYHEWGDSWPHWNELYQAEQYIFKYVKKYSFCYLSLKEKYGTLRYEFINPPRWSWYIFDCWLYFKWIKLGQFVLNKAVCSACKKFPNVKAEILDDYLWMEE